MSTTVPLQVKGMDCPDEIGKQPYSTSHAKDVLCLFAFSMFVSLWGLGAGPGLGDHEAIVAQGACETLQGRGWAIPHVNGDPFLRKPPLPIWLATIASIVVDPVAEPPQVSAYAARLPSGLAAVLTTLLVYSLARSMFGHRIAMVSGGVMTSCAGMLFFSHNAQVEMVLTLFCTASFVFFWFGTRGVRWRKLNLALFYVSLALAMLAKAPLPLGIVGLPLFAWWFMTIPWADLHDESNREGGSKSFWTRFRVQVSELRHLWLLPGIPLFAAIFLPWPVYVYSTVDGVLDIWRMEFLARYTGDLHEANGQFWYYLPILLMFALPFSLSLPEAFASPFRAVYRQHRTGLLFAFTWVAVQVVFLSTSPFKRPHYVAATVPALALLLGPTLDRLFLAARDFNTKKLVLTAGTAIAAVGIALIVGWFFVNREYPGIQRLYFVAAGIMMAGVISSGVTFVRRQRGLALVLLLGFVVACFAWTWDALGRSKVLQSKAYTMIDELEKRSIGNDDRLTSVLGRPDARLVHYMERAIPPLFSDLEIRSRRTGRKRIPKKLLDEGLERLRRRLASPGEEYFLLDVESWGQLRDTFGISAREVFRVAGEDADETDDDWVVITNAWNTGEEEDHLHTTSPGSCQLTFR